MKRREPYSRAMQRALLVRAHRIAIEMQALPYGVPADPDDVRSLQRINMLKAYVETRIRRASPPHVCAHCSTVILYRCCVRCVCGKDVHHDCYRACERKARRAS